MMSLILCMSVFVTAIVLHLHYCRRNPVILHAKVFIVLSVSLGVCAGLILAIFKAPLMWTALIIYLFAIPIYLIFYVTTVLLSPSKKILQIIAASPQADESFILNILRQERFVALRLEELIASGCIFRRNSSYQLAPSGKITARLLNIYQLFLGRGVGG